MKNSIRNIRFALLLPLCIVVTACTNDGDMAPVHEKEPVNELYDNNRVSLSDVMTVVSFGQKKTRAQTKGDIEYEPIVDVENDTLFYLVSYPMGGWRLFASDKRVPAIVAENEFSTFEEEKKNEKAALWLCCMAEDMKYVKHASDDMLGLSKEEIEINKDFWNMVCNPDYYLKKKGKTRAKGDDLPDLENPGHYEIVGFDNSVEIYDTIPHLTPTHWHQDAPFNAGCPCVNGMNGPHRLAGDNAIAGAQTLFCLHDRFADTLQAPSSYSVNYIPSAGTILAEMEQSGFCTNIWDQMVTDSTYAASLVANVAKLCLPDTQDTPPTGDFDLLASVALPSYKVACDNIDYNQGQLVNNLYNGMPVIMYAKGTKKTILFIDTYSDEHTFVVDAYRRYRDVHTVTYRWIYDEAPAHVIRPAADEYSVVTYSGPYIHDVRMNWGWGTHPSNNTWYTLTGSWRAQNQGSSYNFIYKRKMICNYRYINN